MTTTNLSCTICSECYTSNDEILCTSCSHVFHSSCFLDWESRYVMIAHHTWYSKLYKKQWIAAMIVFCWIFAYGMQVTTLCGASDYDPRL